MRERYGEFSVLAGTEFDKNPVTAIGREWMLVTAGTADSWNTLTAAWGGVGFLWRQPVVFSFIRNSRYTQEFMESSTHFTCSFFDRSWRDALNFCGSHSGRDTDKAAATGLTPIALDDVPRVTGSAVGFAQAETIIVARKLYSGEIAPEDFSVPDIHELYPNSDYHRMYIGGIEAILKKTDA